MIEDKMLEYSLKKYTNKLYDGTIILLANVYGKTPISTKDRLRLQAEFFTQSEFDYILTALKKCGYDVLCYFSENKFIYDYLNNVFDKFSNDYLVFNLARNGHGTGKKSLIPTFCDLNNIKYTASSGYACSFSRQKYHINALLKYLGLNCLESYVFDKFEWLNNKMPLDNSKKFIIKPLNESASQGITKDCIYDYNVDEIDEFVNLRYNELNYTPLLIQEFIEGYEAKTTIIEFDKAYSLDPVGVEIGGKYDLGNAIISEDIAFNYAHQNYILNNVLNDKIVNKISCQALAIYKAIGMQNYGRIDCRIDNKTKEIYFIDFSTMPYFVSEGEMLYAFNYKGYDICNLMNSIINSALVSKYNYSL